MPRRAGTGPTSAIGARVIRVRARNRATERLESARPATRPARLMPKPPTGHRKTACTGRTGRQHGELGSNDGDRGNGTKYRGHKPRARRNDLPLGFPAMPRSTSEPNHQRGSCARGTYLLLRANTGSAGAAMKRSAAPAPGEMHPGFSGQLVGPMLAFGSTNANPARCKSLVTCLFSGSGFELARWARSNERGNAGEAISPPEHRVDKLPDECERILDRPDADPSRLGGPAS